MNNIENENFEEYMTYFKTLSLKEKQEIALEQLKMISSLSNEMCNTLNIKNEILVNRELLDLRKENYTEDDFSEAIIVLINSIQRSLCDFNIELNNITDRLIELENQN